MFDEFISLPKIQTLHPLLRDEVTAGVNACDDAGIHIRIAQALRTWEQQADIYDQGRTRPGKIVSNAKPGFSYHNYGLAFDFCLLRQDILTGHAMFSWDMITDDDHDGKKDWDEVVEIFEGLGWEWGGRWESIRDYPHFQKTFGLSISDCIEKYAVRAGQYIEI